MVNAAISVFLRHGRLFVTPVSGAEGMYFHDGEPIALEPTAQALAGALPSLFAQSTFPKEPPESHFGRNRTSKLPALAGLESYAAFDLGAKNVDVRRDDEGFALWKNARLRGGDRFGRLVERRPLETPYPELAAWILSWLER
ncbi:MAG TPA: hypothetical protein VM686_04460 [Polyangiaceae bacterium]|jgi:hypothetical protein|nr:hypothetical protein [Polyangiaceae bacterium]